MLPGRGLQVNCVWPALTSKHKLGAQAAVSPLGDAIDGCGLVSVPMSWIGGLQPPFSPLAVELFTKAILMSSSKRGYSIWNIDRDLKPTPSSFPCPLPPTAFFQGTTEHNLASPKLDHFRPIGISWLPELSYSRKNECLDGQDLGGEDCG